MNSLTFRSITCTFIGWSNVFNIFLFNYFLCVNDDIVNIKNPCNRYFKKIIYYILF